jgi:cell division protein FtsL
MTDQDEIKSNEENTQEDIISALSFIKKVLYSLIIVILLISTAFNLYLSYHNRRLNETLDFYTTQVQRLSMRDQTLDRFFRDLVSFSEDNPELRKLLNKYNIIPEQKKFSEGEEKENSELEDLLSQE